MTQLINQAMHIIEEHGLNRLYCSLTGAPYATLDKLEIELTLEGDIKNDPHLTIDRLIDNWELRLLSMSSQPAPILRGASRKSLTPLLIAGVDGNRRLVTYMLTRLLYPQIGTDPIPSNQQRERMLFAKDLFASLESIDNNILATQVQELSAIDSYCAMPHWHKLWIFKSTLSPKGVDKAPKSVRQAFAAPDLVITDSSIIPEMIKFLFNLVLYASENDSTMGHSGNKLAQALLSIDSNGMPVIGIPLHQKRELSEAQQARLDKQRAANNKKSTRIAWSATHGKGTLPQDDLVTRMIKQQASKLAREVRNANKSQKSKVKSKLQQDMSDIFTQMMNERK